MNSCTREGEGGVGGKGKGEWGERGRGKGKEGGEVGGGGGRRRAVTYIILHGKLLKLVHIHLGKFHHSLPPADLLLQQRTQSATRTTPPGDQAKQELPSQVADCM